MSYVTQNQPDGTPTWIDLGIPDLDQAMRFYGGLLGWTFDVGPAETGHYTQCLLDGRKAAALMPNRDPGASDFWWNVYLASADVESTVARAREAGAEVLAEPMAVMTQGTMALLRDPVGAQVGLWQGADHLGCEVVNEPGALVRNDLVTADPEPARRFYAHVFGFTLDRNENMPGFDFTFLRRPDGHEVGGIMGSPDAARSFWNTTFEVADTDAAVAAAVELGGTVTVPPADMPYGRFATLEDPFGAELSLIARPR
jgi:predicted enzyme related to lactoylglutathione lyase